MAVTADNPFVQTYRRKNPDPDPNHIEDWKELYIWLRSHFVHQGPKKPYNKIVVQFAEAVLSFAPAHDRWYAENLMDQPRHRFLASVLMRVAETKDTREFSSWALELAVASYIRGQSSGPKSDEDMSSDHDDEDEYEDDNDDDEEETPFRALCIDALEIGDLIKRGLLRWSKKTDRLLGTRKLKRRHGITVKIS